jgi:hypothetical protein
MAIVNLSQNTILAKRIIVADRFRLRLKGLLARDSLDFDEALVIKPCKSIHTFFMRFSIDAVFLDRENKVVGLQENMVPFRLSPVFSKAHLVIELPVNAIKNSRTKIGDTLRLEDID